MAMPDGDMEAIEMLTAELNKLGPDPRISHPCGEDEIACPHCHALLDCQDDLPDPKRHWHQVPCTEIEADGYCHSQAQTGEHFDCVECGKKLTWLYDQADGSIVACRSEADVRFIKHIRSLPIIDVPNAWLEWLK